MCIRDSPNIGEGASLILFSFLSAVIISIGIAIWSRQRQNKTGQTFPVFYSSVGLVLSFFFLSMLATGFPLTFEYPELKGFNFKGGIKLIPELVALTFALSMYTASFIAEVVRAGIQSVDKGQTEAAAALGLRNNFIMNLVILPQALRVIIPPMISFYLNITKNSSLALAVGYMDITGTLGGITLNQTGRAIESVLLLMLFYLVISLSISVVMNIYNRSIMLKER